MGKYGGKELIGRLQCFRENTILLTAIIFYVHQKVSIFGLSILQHSLQ